VLNGAGQVRRIHVEAAAGLELSRGRRGASPLGVSDNGRRVFPHRMFRHSYTPLFSFLSLASELLTPAEVFASIWTLPMLDSITWSSRPIANLRASSGSTSRPAAAPPTPPRPKPATVF